MSTFETTAVPGDRIELLGRVRLFGSFTPDELTSLAPRFTERSYRKGEVLFNEGDEGGDFLVVAQGELEVLGGETLKRVVNRLGPGEHLGEMALLLGGRRTATVRVSRAARLLVMDAANFHQLVERNPKLLAVIARALSRQLDARTRGELPSRTTLTIGVSGAPGLKGKTLISNSLAVLLHGQLGKPVLIVDNVARDRTEPLDGSGQLSAHRGGGLAEVVRPTIVDGHARFSLAGSGGSDAPAQAALTELVEQGHSQFPVMVLDLGSHDRISPSLLGDICDVVVEVVSRADSHDGRGYGPSTCVFPVVNLHNKASHPFPVNRCEPFLLRDDPALRRLGAREQAEYLRDHARSPAAPALHRLARKVRGMSVGVALAGGAAFGIAHVGVLKALEEAGVPVDMVTGTSMGSIVGAAYATGMSAEELEELVTQKATKRTALSAVDPSLARPGLLAGSRLTAILRQLGLTGSFTDLALPFQAMATDIETGERVPIGTGPLAAACRASASIPAVFAPVRRDGRILVDGGVVDQVPTTLVREMGADVSIAVTVIPTLRRGVQTVFTRVSNRLNAINPLSYLAGARGMPTMIDLVINALQMLQYQLGTYEALTADFQLEVDTSDFTWVDFHRGPELVERGTKTAEQILPEIQRFLAERPALAG